MRVESLSAPALALGRGTRASSVSGADSPGCVQVVVPASKKSKMSIGPVGVSICRVYLTDGRAQTTVQRPGPPTKSQCPSSSFQMYPHFTMLGRVHNASRSSHMVDQASGQQTLRL